MSTNKDDPNEKAMPLILDEYSFEDIYRFVFKAIMETDSDSIYIKDPLGRFNLINTRVMKNLNLDHENQLIGKTDKDIFGEEFGQRTEKEERELYETGEPISSLVEVRRDTQNTYNWTHTTKIPLRDDKGKFFGLIGFTREINQIKSKESELRTLATHDTLTNVYNRRGLFERIDEMVRQTTQKFALIEIDIDNLKEINDRFLHETGDEFLRWFAWILKSTTRGNDIVSRIGGDEFILVLDNIKNKENVIRFCEKLYDNFNNSIDDKFKPLNVNMSMGISIYPNDSKAPNILIKQADEALYYAKQHGKGQIKFFHSVYHDSVGNNHKA